MTNYNTCPLCQHSRMSAHHKARNCSRKIQQMNLGTSKNKPMTDIEHVERERYARMTDTKHRNTKAWR